MPNTKSAKKRVKISERKRLQNIADKSALKTAIKRFDSAAEKNDPNSGAYLKTAARTLDKAAAKGIIHKNTAARKKSRLAKKLNSL